MTRVSILIASVAAILAIAFSSRVSAQEYTIEKEDVTPLNSPIRAEYGA